MVKMLATTILLLLWVTGTEAECPTRSAFVAAAVEATSVFNSRVVCTNGDVRLAGGGSKFEGWVEVCWKGVWGGVCGDLWTKNNARVVCRQLGFSGMDAVVKMAATYSKSGPDVMLLDSVECSTGLENTLDECEHGDYVSNTVCNTAKIAGVHCLMKHCTDGDVRLFGSSNSNEGVITICKDEKWWALSGSNEDWGTEECGVICSQLHYSRHNFTKSAATETGDIPFSGAAKLDCSGSEDHAGQCTITTDTPLPSEYAKIQCQPKYCEDDDIQVEPNASGLPIGRVLICENENWGTLCMDEWTDDDASVACGSIGHPRRGAIAFGVPRDSNYPVLLTSSLQCKGTEKSFLDCNFTPLVTCSDHSLDPAVQCLRSPCEDGDVRLVNGANEMEGQVEICWKSLWGVVCSPGFGEEEAKVVCRQLGYSRHDAALLSIHGESFGKEMWLAHIQCLESQKKLIDCEQHHVHPAKCEFVDVIRCKQRICEEGEVRLVNETSTNASNGTLEVCIDEVWYNICDENWSLNEDSVICRQLGYGSAISVDSKEAELLLWPPFSCTGTESKLLECSSPPVGDSTCETTLAVSVSCGLGNMTIRR